MKASKAVLMSGVFLCLLVSGCDGNATPNATHVILAPAINCQVPDLVGMDQAAAQAMLDALQLPVVRLYRHLPDSPVGTVIEQDPPAGTELNPCQGSVTITLSRRPSSQPLPTAEPTSRSYARELPAGEVTGWAVLAERDRYSEVGMTDLPIAFVSLSRVHKVLLDQGWERDHIQELRDFDRENLRDGLDWLQANADEDDLVFFYVAGHGTFLRDVVRWRDFFSTEWAEIASERRLLVVDSCQAAKHTRVITDDPQPFLAVAAVAGDEYGWCGVEKEGLPIVGYLFTHFFTAAFQDPTADLDGDGWVSVQEAAQLAQTQQRDYFHRVVLAVPQFVAEYHALGVFPDRDPDYLNVVVQDTLDAPLVLALDAYQ